MALFSSFELSGLVLPNRVVMAPMTRHRAGHGKVPTPIMADYYAQRAGAGLIVSESIEVDPLSGIVPPTRPGFASQAQESGWRQVTDAVHEKGGRIFAQLSHMGRTAHSSLLLEGGRVIGPSALAAEGKVYTSAGALPYEVPEEMSLADISEAIGHYEIAAERALRAGFDGVELHGANGYLIDQFLRDGSNRRTDQYGGSAVKRAQFLIEIFAAVTRHWPANRVGIRVSPTNLFQGMTDSDPVGHFGDIADTLSALKPAYLHVIEPYSAGADTLKVLPAIRHNFAGPVIVAGKYERESAEAVIADGQADLVAFGEKFIANPDLPRRLKEGLPLATADKATFYTTQAEGYSDYPFHSA